MFKKQNVLYFKFLSIPNTLNFCILERCKHFCLDVGTDIKRANRYFK